MTFSSASVRPPVSIALAAALGIATLVGTANATADATTTATNRCHSMTTPVYRSTNPNTRATLLTTWPHESATARAKFGFTRSSGKPFAVSRKPHAGLVAVHRLYQPHSHDFLWTKSKHEVSKATRKHGYIDQGVAFYASVGGGSCLKPVYRYVKSGVRRYVMTTSARRKLTRAGWHYESIAFYGATNRTTALPAPAPSPSLPKPAAPAPSEPGSAGPLDQKIYLSTSTPAWNAYANSTGTTRTLLYQIAATPTAIWLGGRSTDQALIDRIMDKAAAAKRTPVFVLYAIPNRDCGGYAAGGLSSVSQYKAWIDSVRRGLAGRKSVIIVEPDAIGMGCLSSSQRADRLTMLRYALSSLSSKNSWAYLHAGSSGLPAADVAKVLESAGISNARGFAINVSSFDATSNEIAYGKAINSALSTKKHFVIDTSRNGLGRYTGTNDGAPTWCNPPGRALGSRPTTATATTQADAYLWIKPPGESDGQCHDGDPAGWFQSYALGLSQRALDNQTITRWDVP